MKKIIFNGAGKLRNGWWVLIFIVGVALTRLFYLPLSKALNSTGGELLRAPLGALLMFAVTLLCLHLRKQTLVDVGLALKRRWWLEAALGLGLGIAAVSLCVFLICLFGGVDLSLDPNRAVSLMVSSFYLLFCAALLEELLFRGFLFQRLIDGLGAWPAQLMFALIFSIGHWENPHMSTELKWLAGFELGLASLLLGFAYLRSRSLALPIGLHLGWNWAMGAIFGFNVSGHSQQGWLQATASSEPIWLHGGQFGPEASIFAVLVDLLMIALIWRCWPPAQKV